MLTCKSLPIFMRATQKKVDRCVDEDVFVIHELNEQRNELLRRKEALGENPISKDQISKLSKEIALIEEAISIYAELVQCQKG